VTIVVTNRVNHVIIVDRVNHVIIVDRVNHVIIVGRVNHVIIVDRVNHVIIVDRVNHVIIVGGVNRVNHEKERKNAALFNQVSLLRTSSHLQLRPAQDKAKWCDKDNTELHIG
jgi:hypothetical protein